jgi:hypothetical protein
MDPDNLVSIYDHVIQVSERGGYRESLELLGVLESMSWFDNFGEPVYARRMRAVCAIADEFDEVPPQHETMVSHARDYWEAHL